MDIQFIDQNRISQLPPPSWCFLYQIALGFPMRPDYQVVQNYREFYEAMQYVIPDPYYRQYYIQYLRIRPIDLSLHRTETLIAWVLDLHPGFYLNVNKCFSDIKTHIQSIVNQYPIRPTFQVVLFYKNFFLSLQKVIPHHQHFSRKLLIHPIDPFLISREALQQWMKIPN